MKRSKLMRVLTAGVLSAALLTTAAPAAVLAAYPGVGAASKSVNGRSVQLVYVDLNDRNLEVKTVSAWERVGSTESLASLAQRNGALAAINGGYFNAYSDGQPLTVVRSNGEFVHNGSFGAVFGVDPLNHTYFGRIYPTIEGGTKGSFSWPNTWAAWGINHYYDDPNAITILTPEAKKRTLSGGRTIVVQNGVVTNIVDGDAEIPANGYLVHFGPGVVSSAEPFKIGEKAAYRITYRDNAGNPVNWEHVTNMMGGGPMLLFNGDVVIDPVAEKFTDPKQTSRSSRSIRTFIGVTAENKLVMGTVPNVSVYELADTVKALGLLHAVGMDSGATAGLYANGSYLTSPGREVPNSIIVKQRTGQTNNRSGYADVSNSYWATESIIRLRDKGVMSGSEAHGIRLFKPEDNMSRAELATLLTRSFGLSTATKKSFADADGTWYAQYASAAAEAGLMQGYSATEFGGADPVSQEQVVVILSRLMTKLGVKETLADRWLAKNPSSWAEKDVHVAFKQGLLTDTFGDKPFAPTDTAKRAAVAVLLDTALQKTGK